MPFDQTLRDDKNNLIAVALFETHLSKFILEHPAFYQTIYAKVFQAIHNFFYKDPHQNAALQAFLRNKPAHYDLERHLYTIFSRLNEQFPEQTSMRTLNDCFDLPSADYFIKLILDDFLVPSNPSPVMMELVIKAHSSSIDEEESPTPFRAGFFLAHDNLNRRSPYNSTRPPQLFSGENRGAIEVFSLDDESDEVFVHAIGIVPPAFLPVDLVHYFKQAICPARFNYTPKEDSYVALWLRKRHLPVISGTSGSTEGFISRLFPLADLTKEEQKILLLAQACNMVANGHHSFFEAMIVADHFGYKLQETETLLDFYLQCVPESIRSSDAFHAFLNAPHIQPLLMDMPLKFIGTPNGLETVQPR